MNDEKLKVYDNKYFKINKSLLKFSGLWPYVSRASKLIPRTLVVIIVIIFILPHVNAMRIWCNTDLAICAENTAGFVYLFGILLKYTVTLLYSNKIERVYILLADNWLSLIDPEERAIMIEFAEEGKLKSICYFAYMAAAAFVYSQFGMVNIILDFIIPLNESRPKMLVTKGDYGVDPTDYYYQLYIAYSFIGVLSVVVLTAVDTMYTVVVHQSLGIFSIVKYRLQKATEFSDEDNGVYTAIISAIQLHKQGLQFIDIIESSYNTCNLLLAGMTIFMMSLCSIVILELRDETLGRIKSIIFCIGVMIHLFYLTWPGQKVIDQTSDLFIHTYTNEWYNLSEKAKTLIKIMMMRCLKPCLLTAGGIYIMNFANTGAIIKTTMYYITAALSLRE